MNNEKPSSEQLETYVNLIEPDDVFVLVTMARCELGVQFKFGSNIKEEEGIPIMVDLIKFLEMAIEHAHEALKQKGELN